MTWGTSKQKNEELFLEEIFSACHIIEGDKIKMYFLDLGLPILPKTWAFLLLSGCRNVHSVEAVLGHVESQNVS